MIFLFLFDSADIIVVLTYFIRYIDAVLNRKSYKCVVTFCVEFHCFRSLFLAPDRSVSLLLALSRFFCSFFWSFSWRLVSYNLPSCSFFISPLWSSESWMLWRNTPSVIHSTLISSFIVRRRQKALQFKTFGHETSFPKITQRPSSLRFLRQD